VSADDLPSANGTDTDGAAADGPDNAEGAVPAASLPSANGTDADGAAADGIDTGGADTGGIRPGDIGMGGADNAEAA
jgi:hypothetical protein